jgi:hypothetical protein
MRELHIMVGAMALFGGTSSVAAQTLPPCCQQEVRTTAIVGVVDAAGAYLSTDMAGTAQTITLYTTGQHEGVSPRRVDLRRYRGRPIAVVCQLWHGAGDAWGCEAIGRLSATTPVRMRR